MKNDSEKSKKKNVPADKSVSTDKKNQEKPSAEKLKGKKKGTEETTPVNTDKVKTPRVRRTTSGTAPTPPTTDDNKSEEGIIAPPSNDTTTEVNNAPEPTNLIAGGLASHDEQNEIEASIIAPASNEDTASVSSNTADVGVSEASKQVDVANPVVPTTQKDVLPAGTKEQVVFIGGENPDNAKFEDTLRKHMSTIVNFLEGHKKKFNTYKETVEKLLADSAAPGIKYTYDAAAGILTGNYYDKVEIKMPFTVTALPAS